jgi:hypothetical protein
MKARTGCAGAEEESLRTARFPQARDTPTLLRNRERGRDHEARSVSTPATAGSRNVIDLDAAVPDEEA